MFRKGGGGREWRLNRISFGSGEEGGGWVRVCCKKNVGGVYKSANILWNLTTGAVVRSRDVGMTSLAAATDVARMGEGIMKT